MPCDTEPSDGRMARQVTIVSRKTCHRRILPRVIAAMLLASAPTASLGQSEYPSRAIKIVVPLSAGSLPDLVTRVVADRVAARLGQPVVIENRPGAAHNIGAEAVARAEPDGYTLLATPGDTLVVNQHLYPRLQFDPGAFVPISLLARVQTVLVVNPNAGFATLPELVAFARENPDTIKYGSPGTGTFPQLATEILRTAAGIRLVHVPYRGLPLAISDLIAGRIDMAIDALGHSLPHIQDGKLKALGVASEARNPLLPDVPTISETYPGVLTSGGWLAVVAPPGTPPDIAAKLSQAFAETLTLPEVAKRLRDLSVNPVATSPAETARFIRQEAERWGRIILSTGVRID